MLVVDSLEVSESVDSLDTAPTSLVVFSEIETEDLLNILNAGGIDSSAVTQALTLSSVSLTCLRGPN